MPLSAVRASVRPDLARLALLVPLVALLLVLDPSAALAGSPRAHHGAHGRRAATTPDARRPRGPQHDPAEKKPSSPAPRSRHAERAIPAESVGSPNEGHLEGGVHLDLSLRALRVVPVYARGDVRWGLPRLVHMIERAAKVVAKRYPGSVLGVGDLSTRRGGDILRHHSHESGRDADLAFYAVDAKGKPVLARRFLRFDASLASPDARGVRFDVAKNWLLVQAMLTDRKAHVSHIFVSEPLRAALLAHAKKIGVVSALRNRAAVALMQPTGSLPHDDHFHVRISCPRERHSECVEIANGAPMGARAKRTPHRAHHAPLRTPHVRAARSATKAAVTPKAHAHAAAVVPASKAAPDDESLSHAAPVVDDADADAFEVKDALDDVGALRITK